MRTKFLAVLLIVPFLGQYLSSANADAVSGSEKSLETFPIAIQPNCRDGRAKLYDECSDQVSLFHAAAAKAAAEHKTLLVSYGAEWCIWCHVFDAYLEGQRDVFEYTFASPDAPDLKSSATLHERSEKNSAVDAEKLKTFAAEHFVLVHIENRFAPGGDDVLATTGAAEHYRGGIPFVFAVTAASKYVTAFDDKLAEIRRDNGEDWFRGYDRVKLMEELRRMQEQALQKN